MILAAVCLMSLQDATIKAMSAGMSLWQLFLLRSLGALALLACIGVSRRALLAPGRLFGPAAPRAAALTIMYALVYASAPLLPLSVIAAGFYTGPLFIVLMAAALGLERLSPSRALCVALGFLGVLLVAAPDDAAFRVEALLPALGGFFYALAAIITRIRSDGVGAAENAVALNGALLLAGLLGAALSLSGLGAAAQSEVVRFLLRGWTPLAPAEWATLGALAVMIVGIGFTLSLAYQRGSPATIAALDYAYLPLASFWAFIFFAETPTARGAIGLCCIILGGVGAVLLDRRAPQSERANTT